MNGRASGGRLGTGKPRLFRYSNRVKVIVLAGSVFGLAAQVPPVGPHPASAQLIGRALGDPPVSRQRVLGEPVGTRRAQPRSDIPNLNFARVDYWVGRFQTDKRSDFETFLERKGRYEEMIRARLRARAMPEDLLYLAMIESGFDPNIRSRAGAVGIWQFIAETGRRFGLRINRSVDERRDPLKSTEAALSYLKKLHGRFGSWYLAAAAYNTGENRVGRIMREAFGRERGSDLDYYRIWDRLPSETRDYVPLMIAAERISTSPNRYGFGHVRPDLPRYRAGD
jgi:peptidoglycan lytic transglycosylase D